MKKRILFFLFCSLIFFSVEQVYSLPEYYSLKNCGFYAVASENAYDVPTINCPENITVNNTAESCGAVVTYSVTATAPVYSSATIPGYSFVASSGDRYYFLSDTSANYRSALNAAISLGGYLVCINSAAENTLFSSLLSNFWTGGTRDAFIIWSWADETDYSAYSNWAYGEPNDEGNETCMEYIVENGNWNDLNDANILKYVVEMTLSIHQIAGLSSGSSFPVGTTTNTFVVTDYWGNTDTCSFTITVVDNEIPSITCAADQSQTADSGLCDAFVTVVAPTYSDNCEIDTLYNDFNNSSNASGTYPVGVTNVLWTVIDIHGNSNTCTQKITVTDDEDPSITCAADQSQTADPGHCTAFVTVVAPTYSDNCEIDTLYNDFNNSSNASDTFPVGVTNVVWTLIDIHGNSNTCTQKITVTDDEDPSITCAADQTQSNDTGICGAVVTVTGPTTSDNCGLNTVINNFNGTSNATDTYPVGVTNVVWIVTDIHGNSNTCTQKITVTDDEYPSIITPPVYREITTSCDTNIITSPAFSTASAASSYTVFSSDPNNGVAFDNCGIDSVYYQDVITGFYQKTVTRTWTLLDTKGHSVSCTQTILLNPPCNGLTVTDIDGNSYDEVLVGTSCWMKQNLKTRRYSNGTTVPIAKAYYAADYPDTISNINTFGRLYSWYSAVNVPEYSTIVPTEINGKVQGVCPDGWYMPKNEHFSEILSYGAANLKSNSLWLNGLNGTNSTGFTGLPAGFYDAAADAFLLLYGNSGFWSTTFTTAVQGPCFSLDFNCPDLLFVNYIKGNGYSVRCVKECLE